MGRGEAMSGERWSPTGERPSRHRMPYFEAWVQSGVGRIGITYGRYVELREAGTWNDYAREHLGGRHIVEGED